MCQRLTECLSDERGYVDLFFVSFDNFIVIYDTIVVVVVDDDDFVFQGFSSPQAGPQNVAAEGAHENDETAIWETKLHETAIWETKLEVCI